MWEVEVSHYPMIPHYHWVRPKKGIRMDKTTFLFIYFCYIFLLLQKKKKNMLGVGYFCLFVCFFEFWVRLGGAQVYAWLHDQGSLLMEFGESYKVPKIRTPVSQV